jgi:hypothetical protein
LTDYEIGMNLEDRPRKLTDEEIAYITAHLPTAPSADAMAADVVRQGVIEWMVDSLREQSLCPSAISELIQRMVKQHNDSLVVSGTPVGITAAEAVGATTTQMTLNTFHASGGSKSVSFGIEAMRDLIFARKNPKNESCTIYFMNKQITYEEVLNSRHYIVGSVISDFILKKGKVMQYDIDSPQILTRYWWHDAAELLLDKKVPESTKVLRLFLNVPEMYKQHVTMKDIADVLEREVPPSAVAVYGPISDGIIDIYPHPTIIAETLKKREDKGVVPPELAELTYLESVIVPELENIRVKGISGIRSLVPVVSPIWRIVLQERKLQQTDIRNEEARAILGRYVTDKSGWLLFYNPTIMKMTGLVAENLAALCQLAGITIIGGNTAWLVVSMPADRFRTSRGEVAIDIGGIKYLRLRPDSIVRRDGVIFREIPETYLKEMATGWTEEIENKIRVDLAPDDVWRVDSKFYRRISPERFLERDGIPYEQITDRRVKITEMKPGDYVQDKVNTDKRERRAEIKRLSDVAIAEAQKLPEAERKAAIRRPVSVPRTPLMIAAEFVIAETEGSNLKELLALPGIDKRRTTCNNMHTITATLGCEAARNFVIRALSNTISNTGSYVHPANLMFIAEFIMSRGEPYGATYTGISRQPGGHLSLATLERAGKVFTQNALHGRKEDIRNVSASVAVGARMAIGDGAFDIAQDIVEGGVPKTILNDDLFTALERDDETKKQAAAFAVPQPQGGSPEDLTGDINLLKTIALGGTFDDTKAEDETNLLVVFSPGEVIPEITTARQQPAGVQQKVVRRVQPQLTQIEIPRELVDVLDQIKAAVPLPEGQEAMALAGGVIVAPAPVPERVLSTGLIPLTELIPQPAAGELPPELNDIFAAYDAELELQPVPIPGALAITQELPQVEIPALPTVAMADLAQAMIELRREQVRGLQPINTDALQAALQQ